jgi:hypothetical protein
MKPFPTNREGLLYLHRIMPGQTDLNELLKTMHPVLNEGEYVFCTISASQIIDQTKIIGTFKEKDLLL